MGLERVGSFLKKHGREIGIIGKEEPENSIYSGVGMYAIVSTTVGVGEPGAAPASNLRSSNNPNADVRGGGPDRKKFPNSLQPPERERFHQLEDPSSPFLSLTRSSARVATSVLRAGPRETKAMLNYSVDKGDISGQMDDLSNYSTGTACPRSALSVIQPPTDQPSHATAPTIIKTTDKGLERLGSGTSAEEGAPSSLGVGLSSVNSSRLSLSTVSILPPNFDPTIPTLSWIRSEHVYDLTGRITKVGHRPMFEGSFSNVWEGRLDGKSFVAIKALRKQDIGLERAYNRLRREVGYWWCLSHENIIPLLGLAKDEEFGSFGAIISPWYKNGTADDYFKAQAGQISFRERIKLFRDVANGLNYLHTFNTGSPHKKLAVGQHHERITLVHGDLKPKNVLIDDEGNAKLCDFGLLRLISESGSTEMATKSAHTGTTPYLSYEMIVGEDAKPTTASDVHALACLGMEFIYSRPPYYAVSTHLQTDYKIAEAIAKGRPPGSRPEGASGSVSELWNILEQSWTLKPEKRPSAGTVCRFLDMRKEQLALELTS